MVNDRLSNTHGAGSEEVDPWFLDEEEPFEDAVEPTGRRLPDHELERLYDTGTAHIVTQRNDFLIPNLLQSMEERRYINLSPPYQRRSRWDGKRKSLLIESLLMNVPIPPVFLLETDLAEYEVMDGQQRLSTIREFFNNEFALRGLERWSVLNRKRYRNLPPRIQSGLRRRSLSAVILLAESGQASDEDARLSQTELKRYVFQRLNTGGVRLNPQEIRNAVHDGPFNRLLYELSRHELFTKIWGIPPKEAKEESQPSQTLRHNRVYRQMLDCEIVLRFFALQDVHSLAGSLKASLDKTMARYAEKPAEQMAVLRRDYLDCLSLAYEIYDRSTFRLGPRQPQQAPNARAGTSRAAPSRALYDAVMLGIYDHIRDQDQAARSATRERFLLRRAGIVEATNALFRDPDKYELLVGRRNTRQSIIDRIELMTGLFRKHLESEN